MTCDWLFKHKASLPSLPPIVISWCGMQGAVLMSKTIISLPNVSQNTQNSGDDKLWLTAVGLARTKSDQDRSTLSACRSKWLSGIIMKVKPDFPTLFFIYSTYTTRWLCWLLIEHNLLPRIPQDMTSTPTYQQCQSINLLDQIKDNIILESEKNQLTKHGLFFENKLLRNRK